MKSELIEKRIGEYTIGCIVSLLMIWATCICSVVFDEFMGNIFSLFFLGMYWTCAFMHELYTDMKEGK